MAMGQKLVWKVRANTAAKAKQPKVRVTHLTSSPIAVARQPAAPKPAVKASRKDTRAFLSLSVFTAVTSYVVTPVGAHIHSHGILLRCGQLQKLVHGGIFVTLP